MLTFIVLCVWPFPVAATPERFTSTECILLLLARCDAAFYLHRMLTFHVLRVWRTLWYVTEQRFTSTECSLLLFVLALLACPGVSSRVPLPKRVSELGLGMNFISVCLPGRVSLPTAVLPRVCNSAVRVVWKKYF